MMIIINYQRYINYLFISKRIDLLLNITREFVACIDMNIYEIPTEKTLLCIYIFSFLSF